MADEQIIVNITVNSDEVVNASNKINQLTTSIESLSNQIASAKKQNDGYKLQQQELTKLYDQNKISTDKYLLEIDKLNTKIQANNRLIAENKIQMSSENSQRNANIKLIHSESHAYDKLNAEYQIAAKNAKNLAAQYGVNSTQAKNAAANASILQQQLMKIDTSVWQYHRNIGNYTSAWQSFGATLKNMFVAGGIVGLVTMALSKVKEFFVSSVEESQQAQKAYVKVEQAIISTGGAAGYSAQQLKEFDDQLESLTNIDADKIMNDVTAQLLTFTKIQGDEFNRAQKAALDLSTVLGSDLKGTAIQLGKALQDPIKGITALSRSGVSFTASQKEMIKSLVETGRQADAQRLILKELEKQYGGQAEAAAKAGLGPLERLGIIWDNIKESLGNVLIPLINKFATAVGNAFDTVKEWVKTSLIYIVDFINGWIDLYNESMLFRMAISGISLAFTAVWQTIKLFFNLVIDGFKLIGKEIGYVFNPKNWGSGFSEGLAKIISENMSEIGKDVKDFGKNVGDEFNKGIEDAINGKRKHITLDFSSDINGKGGKGGSGIGGGGGSSKDDKKAKEEEEKRLQDIQDAYFDHLRAKSEAELLAQKELNDMLAEENNAALEDARKKNNEFLDKKIEDELRAAKLIEENKKELKEQFFDETESFLQDIAQMKQDEKLEEIKANADAEAEILKNQLDKGIISEDEYNQKILELNKKTKLEEAKLNKKNALWDIAIATAVGVAKQIFNPVLMVAAAAAGAIQAAFVAARPLPTFGSGVNDIVSIGDSHASGNDVDVWGFSGGKKQFFGKVERGEAMPVIRKSAVNDYQIAKLNGKFSPNNRTFANGTPDITSNSQQIDSKELINSMMTAFSNVNIVAKIEDITKEVGRKMEIVNNSKV